MFETWKAKRRIIKAAKAEAEKTFSHYVALEKAKQNFLENPDDVNMIKEILKGIEYNDRVKNILIKKNNGTVITLKLTDNEEQKKGEFQDWINYDALTDSQGVMRVE